MKLYVRIIHEKSAPKEIERIRNNCIYKQVKFNLDEFTEIEAYVSEYQVFFKIPHEYGYDLLVVAFEKPVSNVNIKELFEQVFEKLPPNPFYASEEEIDKDSKQFWEGNKELTIEVRI